METDYKLIKKYPGLDSCIVIGDIVHYDIPRQCYIWKSAPMVSIPKTAVENYPEFWEKIQDYKILEFRCSDPGSFHIQKFILRNDGLYEAPSGQELDLYCIMHTGFCVDNGTYYIYSVQRLSDGKIFTVGDNIGNRVIITKFEIDINKCICYLKFPDNMTHTMLLNEIVICESKNLDFQILEFQTTSQYLSTTIYRRLDEVTNLYKSNSSTGATLNEMLHDGPCVDTVDYIITKVKRLIDGEIFTIGDSIFNDMRKISKFELKNNAMQVHYSNMWNDAISYTTIGLITKKEESVETLDTIADDLLISTTELNKKLHSLINKINDLNDKLK